MYRHLIGIVLQGFDPSQGLYLCRETKMRKKDKNTYVRALSGFPNNDHSVQVEDLLHDIDSAMFGIAVRNIKSKGRNEFTQDVSLFCSAFDISVKFI
jgi:hypothetical protein